MAETTFEQGQRRVPTGLQWWLMRICSLVIVITAFAQLRTTPELLAAFAVPALIILVISVAKTM